MHDIAHVHCMRFFTYRSQIIVPSWKRHGKIYRQLKKVRAFLKLQQWLVVYGFRRDALDFSTITKVLSEIFKSLLQCSYYHGILYQKLPRNEISSGTFLRPDFFSAQGIKIHWPFVSTSISSLSPSTSLLKRVVWHAAPTHLALYSYWTGHWWWSNPGKHIYHCWWVQLEMQYFHHFWR